MHGSFEEGLIEKYQSKDVVPYKVWICSVKLEKKGLYSINCNFPSRDFFSKGLGFSTSIPNICQALVFRVNYCYAISQEHQDPWHFSGDISTCGIRTVD
jgi:hypothetical protein